MNGTRDAHAKVALDIYLACWQRGFVLCRMDGRVLALGGFADYAPVACAVVRKFEDVLLPRTPPVHDENARR